MTQHINLLRSERSAPRDALQLLPVVVVALIGLAGVAAARWSVGDSLAQTQEAARKARALAAGTGSSPSRSVALDDKLSRELTEGRARLARVETIEQQLREIETAQGLPFSGLLDALARRTTDGVWLVGLSVDESAQRLTLVGRALEANRVPSYLKQLNREPVLRERRFQAMDVSEAAAIVGTPVIEFRLSTSPLPKGKS